MANSDFITLGISGHMLQDEPSTFCAHHQGAVQVLQVFLPTNDKMKVLCFVRTLLHVQQPPSVDFHLPSLDACLFLTREICKHGVVALMPILTRELL